MDLDFIGIDNLLEWTDELDTRNIKEPEDI